MFLLIAYCHSPPEPLRPASDPPAVPVEVMVSCSLLGLMPAAVRAGRLPVPFHTNLPVLTAASQQECLCTRGQAGAQIWSKWKPTQPKPHQMRKASTKGTRSLSRERHSALFAAAAPARAKWKWWQPQTDLPHRGLSPNIPHTDFFCVTNLSIACSHILIQTLGWKYTTGPVSKDTLEKRKELQLCKNLEAICHHVILQLRVLCSPSLNLKVTQRTELMKHDFLRTCKPLPPTSYSNKHQLCVFCHFPPPLVFIFFHDPLHKLPSNIQVQILSCCVYSCFNHNWNLRQISKYSLYSLYPTDFQ